jgi:hypothetical protein
MSKNPFSNDDDNESQYPEETLVYGVDPKTIMMIMMMRRRRKCQYTQKYLLLLLLLLPDARWGNPTSQWI